MKYVMSCILGVLLSFGIMTVSFAAETGAEDKMMDGVMALEETQAPAYTIDPVHSTIGFAVKHLQIATTRGKFNEYSGIVHYDPDNLDAFKAEVTIRVDSIDTGNEKRDQHLLSGDFFLAEEYPVITFESSRLDKRGEGHVIVGELTIRGVTKELTFPVDIAGPVPSPFGQKVMALSAETVINRQDFGISWSKQMDGGGFVVADEVKLIVELELHQQDS